MTQQKPVISHSEAPASEDVLHGPRTGSPDSTYSGSSPGASQGKVSVDVDRNAGPFSNGFIHTATHDFFLSVPNRMVATVPFTSPSQLAVASPVPSSRRTRYCPCKSDCSSPCSSRLKSCRLSTTRFLVSLVSLAPPYFSLRSPEV